MGTVLSSHPGARMRSSEGLKTVPCTLDEKLTLISPVTVPENPTVRPLSTRPSPEATSRCIERTLFGAGYYMIRAAPGRRDAMMPLIEDQLARDGSQRVIRNLYSMSETRKRGYLMQDAMATILTVVMVVLTLITSLGIMGLASFSVNRRTKEIGTRRALGATKRDILRHFLLENFLITTVGVVLGGDATIAFNMWLVKSMGFPKIDWIYVPLGMLALSLIGLLSVYGPARRACAVPPAVATRTV